MFVDRNDAALKLATKLAPYKGQHALVLAIPRGGVPIAKIVADAIEGELDVVLVHKLGHKNNPEYAIGAIDEEGQLYLDDDYEADEESAHLEATKASQLKRLKSLRAQYTPLKKAANPEGRTVIIVDDGVATGWTAKAAVAYLKRALAKRIVIATPVAPQDTLTELKALVDDVVCLAVPLVFHAVGEFYADFGEVSDEDVARLLSELT